MLSSDITIEGDFLLLNADGDVESLVNSIQDRSNSTLTQSVGWVRKRNLRCSAIFKLAPGNKDIMFGHATWDHFTMMAPRMLKTYTYPPTDDISGIPENDKKGVTVTMSSSAGFLSSVDDFYLTSKGLSTLICILF